MGIWSLLKIVLGYMAYLFLGVDQGVINKLPFYAGEGNKQAGEEVKNAAFSFMMIVSFLTSIVLLVTAVILRHRYQPEVIVGLCVLSVYVVVINPCVFYQMLLRAKHNFSVLSKSIIFEAVINLILILLLVSKFKIYGLYIVLILVALLNMVFMHLLARYKFSFNLNLKRIAELIKVGFPITVVGFLEWGLTSLDRIMIAKMMGLTYVGYYSIPIMARAYVEQLSGFGTILYPRILEAYGKEQKIEDIKKYVIVPPMVNAYVLPLILGLIFLMVPLLVKKILPQFIPGILAMQILLLDMFFRSCCVQASHFLYTLEKQARLVPLVAASIVMNGIGNYVFIKMGYGIYGVAAATSIVTFVYFIVNQSYAMRHFARKHEIFLFLVKMIVPVAYVTAVVIIMGRFLVIDNDYLEFIVRSCLLMVFSLPLLFYINRTTGVISLVMGMLRRKIGSGTL